MDMDNVTFNIMIYEDNNKIINIILLLFTSKHCQVGSEGAVCRF
jgi:hypothetical protein